MIDSFLGSTKFFDCVLIQYKIKTIQDLVSLKASDRHNLLHFLEDEKYEDVMAVLGSFPHIIMDIKSQGKWRCCWKCQLAGWFSKHGYCN